MMTTRRTSSPPWSRWLRRHALHVGMPLVATTGGPAVHAQVTAVATATASANVVAIAPLTATTVNELDFGSLLAGTSTTVAPADGARFQITGQPNFPVNVVFTLPSVLTGPSASTISISFGPADGLVWAPFPTTFTTFDPTTTFGATLDPTGNLEIGLRGTVVAPPGTTPGAYTGSVTITVAY